MSDDQKEEPKKNDAAAAEAKTVPFNSRLVSPDCFVLLETKDWEGWEDRMGPGGTVQPDTLTDDQEELLQDIPETQEPYLEPLETIGQGGMGVVELAHDLPLRRRVAKKSMNDRLDSSSTESLKTFIREARITAQLEHPNIVPIHKLNKNTSGSLYFTMKLVEGRSLSEMLKSLSGPPYGPSDLLDLLDIVIKVCDALSFAHSRGVIHCDLKPSNIMVGDFGEVYLMDWGVARVFREQLSENEKTDAGNILGTPAYMSPEQACGMRDKMDPRSDVFSMGAVLYTILTGQPPYAAASVPLILLQAGICNFRPPTFHIPNLPKELERIVLKAMAKKPKDRYRDVESLKRDLAQFIRGESNFSVEKHEAGSVIIREGEAGDKVYFIVRGLCKVTKEYEGEEVFLRNLGPGDAFGEMAILSPGPRTATVEAIEDTMLYAISQEALKRELDSMKPWMGAIIRTAADRFREQDRQSIPPPSPYSFSGSKK